MHPPDPVEVDPALAHVRGGVRVRGAAFAALCVLGALSAWAGPARAQAPLGLMDGPCTPSDEEVVTEPETGRTYLLDYPCDLTAGEEVTFVLSLHGGGSSHRWQHGYFPVWEQKEAHRLVIATPFSPTRRWSEDDDAYLRNIVTSVIDELGRENIRAFWLAGHSQGGSTSRRIVCTDFFESKVDGFLSLSGGRLGGAPERAPNAGRPRQADDPPPEEPATQATRPPPPPDPSCDFSHIYSTGEHEIVSLPTSSEWAERYGCGARVRLDDVVDTEPGYVHDGGHQNPATPEWGRLPRPGTAEVFQYPDCDGGRVVADVVRIDKGHTEGLEPRVTEEIVRLMTSASGGKIRQGG